MVTDTRNRYGFKDSVNMYRKGGDRVCWCDGFIPEITDRVVKEIRQAGFQCWRTKDTVWIRKDDETAIATSGAGKTE